MCVSELIGLDGGGSDPSSNPVNSGSSKASGLPVPDAVVQTPANKVFLGY